MVKIFSAKQSSAKRQSKPVTHNKIDITSIDQEGRGVARIAGKVTFVQGALPSEVVNLQIIEQSKQFDQAKVTKVLTPSQHRVAADCAWYQQCGGCQLQHLAHDQQLVEKQQLVDSLLNKAGWQARDSWQPAIQSDGWHYRNRARLSCYYQGKRNQLQLGFRQHNSKKLAEVEQCKVLVKPFAKHIHALGACLNGLINKKQVQHIDLNQVGAKACIGVRVSAALKDSDYEALRAFCQSHDWAASIDDGSGKKYWLVEPETELTYQLNGLTLSYQLDDFTQVNSQMNQAMVQQALSWLDIQATDNVLDCFSGLGNFTLPIAQRAANVLGIEGNQAMVDKAQANAQRNQLNNCQFEQADLNKSQLSWSKFDKILLDPSRSGAQALCQQSEQWHATKVLYIACHPNSLARDGKLLIDNGFHLKKIGLIDMFPHTSHVETMALFEK